MTPKRPHNEPHPGEIEMQTRSGTRLVGRRLIAHIRDGLSEGFKEFIEAQWMFFMATSDDEGRLDCNYRGGNPGFVKVFDGKTLLFPDYNGNGSYMSLGNLRVNPTVGLLFIDFETQQRLRVNGRAEIIEDPEVASQFEGAERVVKVTVEQAFPNCSRYIHRMVRVGPLPKEIAVARSPQHSANSVCERTYPSPWNREFRGNLECQEQKASPGAILIQPSQEEKPQ